MELRLRTILWLSLFGCGLSSACLEDESIAINLPPTAHAGEDRALPYAGVPLTVRLDGSKSSDDDGSVVAYRWLLVDDVADAGLRYVRGDLDPDDVASPEVELDEGSYTFLLWVTDDDGSVSEPDQVTIGVGADPVAQCVADSLDAVPERCRSCVCNIDDACRAASVACREDCWALIACIGQNCPDSSDTACIIDACADSLGGSTGATEVGPCVIDCVDSCAGGSDGSEP